MTLKEMQERREKLVADARAALEEIRKNTDDARVAELEQRHDAIMVEFDKLEADIRREERVAAAERSLEERRAANRPIGPDVESRTGAEEEGAVTYRSVFYKLFAVGGELGELSTEERAVLRAGVAGPKEMRSLERRAQTAGTTTAGGYTVPVELANILIKSMAMWGPMYDEDICTTLATASGNQINLPTVDDTGTAVVKHTEGTALTDDGGSDVTFGQKRLDAFVYDSEFVRFSMELAQDSIFNFEQLLGDLIGERLGRRANVELTTGDGNGDPNGIVTASSLGVTTASATAITFDELMDLEHSVDPAYRMSPKAAYMLNDATLLKLRKLKGGDGQYIWQAGNVQQGVPGTLNGRRYHINQAMPAATAGLKSVVFGDFGKYFVRKVGAPIIGVLKERFWPDLGVAGLIRLDGELGDAAAVKHMIMHA